MKTFTSLTKFSQLKTILSTIKSLFYYNKIIHSQKPIQLQIFNCIYLLDDLKSSMFLHQPKIQKHTSLLQRQPTEVQSLRMTKLSSDLRTTKISQNIRSTKLTQALFITSKPSPKKQKPAVQKVYTQLHNYIDTVDQKINYLLQKQSNEYKVVYQHYYNKFRDELLELKQKTSEQEKIFQQNDHVLYIQKELKITRQQASTYQNLYIKLKKQNQRLKAAIDFYKKDIAMLQNTVKQNLKEIKSLNSKTQESQVRLTTDGTNNLTEQNQKVLRMTGSNRRSNSLSFQFPQKPQIKISLQNLSPKFNCLKSDYKLSPHSNILSAVANQMQNQSIRSFQEIKSKELKPNLQERLGFSLNTFSKQKNRFDTEISQKAQNTCKVFNICEWFLECVQAVKKQIFQRKLRHVTEVPRLSNQFKYLESLDDFLKLDKLQVMKMFLSRDQVIEVVYNLLKNEKNLQEEQNLHRISQYQNPSEIRNSFKNEAKPINQAQTRHGSFNQTMNGLSKKFKFNKTMIHIKSLQNNKHHSMYENNQYAAPLSTTNANERTSISMSKEELICIDQSGQTLPIHIYEQRPQTIAGLLENRNLKKLSLAIKEKKNVRLSTHLYSRRKNIACQ